MPPHLNPGTIIRETLSLEQDLLNGQKISELDRWVGNSKVRQLLLQHLTFGRIRWHKSNGKPLSPTLNQGFTILYLRKSYVIMRIERGPKGVASIHYT
jgi:hypothetical protein